MKGEKNVTKEKQKEKVGFNHGDCCFLIAGMSVVGFSAEKVKINCS